MKAPVVRLAAIVVVTGSLVGAWAWAVETLLGARGKEQSRVDWIVAAVLLAVGLAILVRAHRLALVDATAMLILAGLVGNAFLWVGQTGAWDCTLGGLTPEPSAETTRIVIPTEVADVAEGLAENTAVSVVVVSAHHKANDEVTIESAVFSGTYRGRSNSALSSLTGAPVVELDRGPDDSSVATFLIALGDAERVTVLPAPPSTVAPAPSCNQDPTSPSSSPALGPSSIPTPT